MAKHSDRNRPLNAAQVLNRLAEIELAGLQFYQGLYEGSDSERVKQLAKMMAKAELRHHKRFLKYAEHAELRAAEENAPVLTGPLPDEVARPLYADVFVNRERVKESAKNMSDIEAIQVAIRAEESTALLMTQLRSFVRGAQKGYITRVIKEEWGHKARLEELMQKHFLKQRK